MKVSKIYKSLLALAAPFMFAACSNEGEPNMPVVEEEFEGIVLNIPVNQGTRATDGQEAPDNTEAAIKTLWVFAYAQNNKGTTYIDQITVPDSWASAYPVVDTYKSVDVKLMSGEYHIYVLANIAATDVTKSNGDAMDTDMKKWTESDLQGAKLTSQITPGAIPSTGIPMSANYDAIMKNTTDVFNSTDNIVPIAKGQAVKVYAPLTFCVAKVRFTMLNSVNPDITMNGTTPLEVSDYASVVGLMSQLSGPDTSDGPTTISTGDYYKYPTLATGVTESAWTPVKLETKETDLTGSWAYQAVFYIPEHVFASGESAKKSTLAVNFNEAASAIDKTIELGEDSQVLRSHFYDYFGYVGKKEVTLQARVKEWGYFQHSIDLEDL